MDGKKETLCLFFLIKFLILTSCQTAEQIRRSELIEGLSVQMAQSQKILTDLSLKSEAFAEQMQKINGKVEDLDYSTSSGQKKDADQNAKRFQLLEEKLALLEEALSYQKSEIASVREYIQNITQTLQKVNKKKGPKERFKTATKLYNKKQYNKAKLIFETLQHKRSFKKLKRSQRVRLQFLMAMIEYHQKKYENAAILLGNFYTKHPYTKYSGSTLYHLAKSFLSMDKIDESLSTLRELIKKFPKSKYHKKGKRLLREINNDESKKS